MAKSPRGGGPNLLQLQPAGLPSPTSCGGGNSSSSSTSHNHYNNNTSSSIVTTTTTTTTSDGIAGTGIYHNHHHYSNPTTPRTPTTTTRSDPNANNPYPTTFVQADTTSFKQVVQMLTGSTETVKQASTPTTPSSTTTADRNSTPSPSYHHPPRTTHLHHHQIPPIRPVSKPKPSRLLERRNSQKPFRLSPLIPQLTTTGAVHTSSLTSISPRRHSDILSPSLLDFPSLVLSPVTPLIPDPFNRSSAYHHHTALTRCAPHQQIQPQIAPTTTNAMVVVDRLAEEKAIAEKGFYLHRSPATTPRGGGSEQQPPRLLPLFPVTSPKLATSGSSDLSLSR